MPSDRTSAASAVAANKSSGYWLQFQAGLYHTESDMRTFPSQDVALVNRAAKCLLQNALHLFPVKFHRSRSSVALVGQQQGSVPLPIYTKQKAAMENVSLLPIHSPFPQKAALNRQRQS